MPHKDISSLPDFGAGEFRQSDTRQTMHQPNRDREGNNPDAFLALPESVVEKIGLYTHMGARVECAALSRLLYEDKHQDTSKRSVAFQGAGEFQKPSGSFILSIETIASDLWERWFHRDGEGEHFERFYERLCRGVERLEEGGWVKRDGHPLEERRLGYLWSFHGTFLSGASESLPQTKYSGARLLHSGAGESAGLSEDLRSAVDVIGEAFVPSNPKRFSQGEIVTSLTRKGRGTYGNIYSWSRQVAEKGASGPRFTSVGAWKEGEEGLASKPHVVPWIVWDIDRGYLPDALGVAKSILERLERLGAPLHKVHVSFSGKKGFHIRVPSGMAGAPVFGSRAETMRILRRFSEEVSDTFTDLDVCDPTQNIRLIGSTREHGAHVVAWSGEEFRGLSLQDIGEASREHHPYEIGHVHPLTIASVPALVKIMVGAMDTTRKAQMPSFGETKSYDDDSRVSGVIRRAKEGCEEGVTWWDKGDTFHEGRSKLLFIVACHFLRNHRRKTAWAKLQEVNEKCDPPMTRRELEGRFKSAKRNVNPGR